METTYKYKGYLHFDGRKNIGLVKNYVENSEMIKAHSFYPFIHYKLEFNKFSIKGKKPKVRDIYYCSHIDRYIYQRYASVLSEKYNTYLLENNFNECSIAYRTNKKGKCNIHFAKEVFDFLKKQKQAYIFVGDFTNFFDELEHGVLKENICRVMGKNQLDEDEYKIFKNIKNFSYIELDDICTHLEIPENLINRLKNYEISPAKFREIKDKYLKHSGLNGNKTKNYGIPQGSPISAVYANVYMIDFDKQLKHMVEKLGGIYRRYSDDFIIIFPKCNKEEFQQYLNDIFKIKDSVKRLILHKEKTEVYEFINNKIIELDINNLESLKESSLGFLGFLFNGKEINYRGKTITKFYYKIYRKIDKHINNELYFGQIYLRYPLLKRLSKIKKKSFLGYAERSSKAFKGEKEISRINKNIRNKITRRFNPNANRKIPKNEDITI